MKKYIGTKEVKAHPMDAESALELGYRTNGRSGNEAGYEVEYEDGYRAWSPKEVFDKFYRPSETFYDRLIIEHKDLAIKLEGLKKMIESDRFKSIDIIHQMDLQNQYKAMSDYEFILYSRIQALSPTRDMSGGTNM